MSRAPAFSIITPTYQAAEFVRRCHWSLAQQTVKDWEWIIVDDASGDDTADIVHSLDDPRIRYHRFYENRGRGPARNHALQLARGDWSAILDMDDFCFPDRLEVASGARRDGYDFLCSSLVLIDGTYAVSGVREAVEGGYPRSFPHATLCGATSVLASIGYPSFRRAQDQTMVLTIANSKRGCYYREPLYVYHENASITLRGAYQGQYAAFRQLSALVRKGALLPTWGVRRLQLRHAAKLAVLTPFFLWPSQYRRTLRLRANAVGGTALLSETRRRFIAECGRHFPMPHATDS